MKGIFTLGLFKTNARIKHALLEVKDIDHIDKHPATWGVIEDPNFLMHLISSAKPSHVNLDHLINGNSKWARVQAPLLDRFG